MDPGPGDQLTAVVAADERKLVAVVYADIAGYSRLIGIDDADTLARLQKLRRELIDPLLERHGGTLVNTAGDSMLCAFDSILAAMRFAVEVQRAVPDFDGDYAPGAKLRFRMGVNAGDVIMDGANRHGESVNIAARLQTVAPPGGICVSRVVRDHVGNRLGFGFRELGAIELKNIARPVEAFVANLTPDAIVPPLSPPPARRSRRIAITALGCVALIAAGFAVTRIELRPGKPAATPPIISSDSNLPPLSIAVLPFENLSDDPDQAYLADGIAEDLTTDLSHLDNAFVIARESAFTYRGKAVDMREVGRELGVRYVVEGSVRKMSGSVRITAQLIATDTGAHVWAERFDKPIKDLGEGQDDIVTRIAAALGVRMVDLDARQRARAQNGSPAAFDLVLRARSVLLEPPSIDRDFIALGLFLQALRIDPKSVPAMTGVAEIYAGRLWGNELIKRASELVAQAGKLAPGAPDVLIAKFLQLQRERRSAEALALYRHLLEVDPSATGTILQIGLCRCWTANAEAIPLLQKTIKVNPLSANLGPVYNELARSLLIAGRAEEARDELRTALARPRSPQPPEQAADNETPWEYWRNGARVYLAIADVRTGRLADAQEIVRQVLQAKSMREFTSRAMLRDVHQYDDPDAVAQQYRFADDLRRAGLRDHLDEDADSGVPATDAMQDFPHLNEPTPMSILGGRMVRTREVATMLATQHPVVLTTSTQSPTVPGAIYVDVPATGDLHDAWQANLGRLMEELTHSDLHRPIIVFAVDINRWIGRNLALRLIALGYTDVAWYRGGWEAWDASGQPRAPLASRREL